MFGFFTLPFSWEGEEGVAGKNFHLRGNWSVIKNMGCNKSLGTYGLSTILQEFMEYH